MKGDDFQFTMGTVKGVPACGAGSQKHRQAGFPARRDGAGKGRVMRRHAAAASLATAAASSSSEAQPSADDACQYSAGMLPRRIQDLTVWMETPRRSAISSALPASRRMVA